MPSELYEAIQRLMVARALKQHDSVLGRVEYDLLVHVMMVAFGGLSHAMRLQDEVVAAAVATTATVAVTATGALDTMEATIAEDAPGTTESATVAIAAKS